MSNQTIDGVPGLRSLLERLAKIENISRDEDNGPGRDLCPVCFGDGQWNWVQGSVKSIDPIEHEADCPLAELRALLDAKPIICRGCMADGVSPDHFDSPGKCKSGQPQVEPVAEIVEFGNGLKEVSWRKGKMPELGTKLYAEQPAPVTHTMKSVMEAICKIDGFPMLTSNQCHALAVKLNDTSGAKV